MSHGGHTQHFELRHITCLIPRWQLLHVTLLLPSTSERFNAFSFMMHSPVISNSGAFFRFAVVCLLFVVNLLSLVRLLFRAEVRRGTCVHFFIYGLMLIALNLYLSTWIPYLFSSFYHATPWPLLEVSTHCAIQHLVTGQVTTLLLVFLCLQKLFETFCGKRAKLLSCVIFFTWILPQAIYSVISEIVSSTENSNLYFMDSGLEFDRQRSAQAVDSFNMSQGVLFCIHRLDSSVISHMTWHYVVLVVPLTSLFVICSGAKRFAKSSLMSHMATILPNVNCQCTGDIVICLCLALNFVWLLFARPLLSLIALLQSDSSVRETAADSWKQPTSIESLPLDLGSHFLLFLISALLPFSTQFGLFPCTSAPKSSADKRKKVSPSEIFYLPRV